jgi:hypothetical protein
MNGFSSVATLEAKEGTFPGRRSEQDDSFHGGQHMSFSKPALIAALVLTACGSSSSTSSSDGGTNPDSGTTPDAGGTGTGSCTVGGAATGTINVFGACGNVATSGAAEYAFTLVTNPANAKPNVGGTYYFGASKPTVGSTYTLAGTTVSGSYFPYVAYTGSGATQVWMAGDLLQAATTNGSISLKLTNACDETTRSHGTLTATLKPITPGPADVTLDCSF